MDQNKVRENRLWNLRQIITAAGGTNEAARIMQKKNSYVTQIAGPNPQRNIGNRMPQSIEQAFGLAPGSLDADPPKQSRGDDYLSRICATLANAPERDKEFVLAMSEWLAGRSMKLPSTKTGIVIKADDLDP